MQDFSTSADRESVKVPSSATRKIDDSRSYESLVPPKGFTQAQRGGLCEPRVKSEEPTPRNRYDVGFLAGFLHKALDWILFGVMIVRRSLRSKGLKRWI